MLLRLGDYRIAIARILLQKALDREENCTVLVKINREVLGRLSSTEPDMISSRKFSRLNDALKGRKIGGLLALRILIREHFEKQLTMEMSEIKLRCFEIILNPLSTVER